MNTPELWRDVTVKLDYGYHNGCKIDLAHEWLSHAGDMPRSLKITAQDDLLDDSDEWCTAEVVDLLVVPFRFRSLDLSLTRGQFQRVLDHPPQTQSLHSLQLMAAFPQDVYEDCSAYNLITTLPWSQLRHLSIEDASSSASTLMNVLSSCSVLEELWIILCPDPVPCDTPASFITLPNLEQLTLYFLIGSNPEIFFRSLIMPHIKWLDISMMGFRTEMLGCTSLHFANMAQRSGMSRIQGLRLSKGVEPYRLVDLLKYTPSLSHLDVNGDVVSDSQTLEDMSTGQLGPNMKSLFLPELEDSRFFEMVWTRFQNATGDKTFSVTPIKSITISAAVLDNTEVDVEGWVNELRDLGIYCSCE